MKKLLLASLLLSTCTNAYAGLISFSDSFGTQGSAHDVTVGKLDQTLSIKGFDTNLGQLDRIDMYLFGQLDTVAKITNNGIGNINANVKVAAEDGWRVESSVADTFFFSPAHVPLQAFSSEIQTISAGNSFDFGHQSTGVISNILDTYNMSQFITNDNINFNFLGDFSTTYRNHSSNGSDRISIEYDTATWGAIQVDYHYSSPTNVPEPSLLAILMISFFYWQIFLKNGKHS